MSEEVLHHDDQSHYEVSLTAGQAFMAFVLLLLSLAASFAFGLLIGKGQGDDRLVAKKDSSAISEAAVTPSRRSAASSEVPVAADDFQPVAPARKHDARRASTAQADDAQVVPVVSDGTPSTEVPAPVPAEAAAPRKSAVAPLKQAPATMTPPVTATVAPPLHPAVKPVAAGPVYAQILSTGDQKTADALAAKLIDGGFNSAYVERSITDKGTVFRVRVRFPSETEAKANETKLKAYSKDVWIVK